MDRSQAGSLMQGFFLLLKQFLKSGDETVFKILFPTVIF